MVVMFFLLSAVLYLTCVDARFIRATPDNEITNENLSKFRNQILNARKTGNKTDFQTPDVKISDVVDLLKEAVNATEEVNPPSQDNSTRQQRQETDDVEFSDNGGTGAMKESQESEEDENMVTGLISAFLGGLSRPDGGVDVEAITGLLGSLSAQRDDGSYDFSGLTELLMSFFGGDDEGGSDFGAFVGGIAGAFIKGVASPPGAKGVGSFLGKIVSGVLPALSAPAPTEEGAKGGKPQPPADPGSFLFGFLNSFLTGSSAQYGNSSNTNGEGGGGSKFSLFKAIFSIISSIFYSSSSSKY